MRKILLNLAIFFSFFSFFLFGLNNDVQASGTCKNWICTTYWQNGGQYENCHCGDGSCLISPSTCSSSGACGPGTYVCNRNGGSCCPVGPPPSSNPPPNNPPPAGCSATQPTGFSVTRVNPTSAQLNWTPGANGDHQNLYVSTDSNPYVGCAGSQGGTAACPVREDESTTPLGADIATYTINGLLSPSTTYYWEVVNVQTSTCYSSTTAPYISSCTINPSSVSVSVPNSQIVSSSITSGNGIQKVVFTSSDQTIFTVNGGATYNSTTYPYETTVKAIAQGGGILTSDVYTTNGALSCSATAPVNILPPPAWWQVKDSDVNSGNDLTSSVWPAVGNYFNLAGPGGYPGVSAYGGATNLTSTNTSVNSWLAASPVTNPHVYNYNYLVNLIPSDVLPTINTVDTSNVAGSLTSGTATHDSNNYYWFKYDGATNGNQPLTLNTVNVGTRKVILLVANADLNITGDVNLTYGQGFFMTIVNGKITVDPTVGGGASPNLEGMYFSDGVFDDSSANLNLWVRGSVAAEGGLSLQRNLGGNANSSASELFEFAPDQIMLYPTKDLGTRDVSWKEVAP